MAGFSITIDTRAIRARLDDLAKKQLPFAMATALNATAKLAATEANAAIPGAFERANRFTQMAVFAPPGLLAKKDSLSATVAIRPLQLQYLGLEILGGNRSPANNTRVQSTAFVVPGTGSTPLRSGAVKRIAAQAAADRAMRAAIAAHQRRQRKGAANSGVFEMSGHGPLGGPGGFFRRLPGHHLTRLISFESSAAYKPKWDFRRQVLGSVNANFSRIFAEQFEIAMKTAKRCV